MSDISPHQSVFRVSKADATRSDSRDSPPKRNRQAVSCMACRTRKLVIVFYLDYL